MEKFVKYFLSSKSFTWLLMILILGGGLFSYFNMGKLEDAPFTIKQAVVITPYPGASPMEVETEVTDVLAEAIQEMGELYYIKTDNREGLSKMTIYLKKELRADQMQQSWDLLRRKVGDAQAKLPEGASKSIVQDDFGDVLGVFYGLHGQGFTPRQLEDYAIEIKNGLLNVKDVAKVTLYGIQKRSIEIAVDPAVMAQTGITSADIALAFNKQNKVVDAGAIESESNRFRIEASGSFNSLEEIQNLIIVSQTGEYFKLNEIARITESYVHPQINEMRVDNNPAVGIAVATVSDGNVVEMAEAVEEVVASVKSRLPEGLSLTPIYDQGLESAIANEGFITNLIVSVITVIAVLLFFIGVKNGILIGSGLIFSVFGTLIYMFGSGIALQRMSLAAIIIAMGMLVDNAIVVYDSSLVNMQKGMRKRVAILKAVKVTAMPLLAATVIAIITFLPIYYSPHITGELLSSLVIVIGVSLLLSWVFAITQNVFFVQEFVARPRPDEITGELFQGKIYNSFRKLLGLVVQNKYIVVSLVVVLLFVSGWGFKYIPTVFMPQLDKQYFTIDMWMPEGTRIEEMNKRTAELVDYVRSQEQTEQVSSFVGQTPPRYYLANVAFGPQSNYAQCLVKATSPKEARALQGILREGMNANFPDMFVKVNRFELSVAPEALIEARFLGPDVAVLDSLTQVAIDIMNKNPKAAHPRNEWKNRALMVKAHYDPINAGKLNISKASMMQGIKAIEDGLPVGIYRDNEKKVPVLLKSSVENSQMDLQQLGDYSVWNGDKSAPLSQLTKSIELDWEYPIVKTYDRQLSMAAQCDVVDGATMREVLSEIKDEVESIELPDGYTFFWDSQIKDQSEAMQALLKFFPLAILFLILILVGLFKNFKQPLIIFLMLPLSLIGVSFGLLATGLDFGFFGVAGWLGLLGMIIKNVIVLLDEVNIQRGEGKDPYSAIIESTVARAKPVLMAAGTTILGMVPLLFDVVFGGMAATIVFGLSFATLLTLLVTPALYAVFYKVQKEK
ncbi:efflux RND transporter permease subunit [Bacteroides coprosuis]|uniref:efflux RND transporter permease subunit n=2 Tax=Bacteroides TaxID=816 RepID=UPI001E163C59|nr:efflux RND transporter permease subunit [Bacteroides coprosuis]HJD92271.1 efflux RND transporter permease subunit [Bacteroides coprosuis]